MLANWFAAEASIVSRIQAKVTGLQKVLTVGELAGVTEQSQFAPSAQVWYAGYETGPSAGQGAAQVVRQKWTVFLVVRNVRDQLSGQSARADAGPLFLAMLQALDGWAPSSDHGPLRLLTPSVPPLFTAGFAYFPASFYTLVSFYGNKP